MRKFYSPGVITLLFVYCLAPVLSQAGEIRISNGANTLTTQAPSYQQFAFRSEISSVQFRDIQTRLGTFTELYIKDYGYSLVAGSPKLPVYRRLIEVPVGAGFEIRITRQEFTEYDLAAVGISSPLIPAQAPVSKSITDPDQIPFVFDAQAYQKDEYLGGPLVKVSAEGTLRAVSLAEVEVSPVWYNPVTGKLRVYQVIEASVVFTGADIPATLARKSRYVSPYFEKAYRMIGNYSGGTDQLITTSPVTFVIVSDPMFQQALQPFVHWKTRKGFKVIQGYTSDPAVGTTNASIKNYLKGLYENPPAGYNPPSFVLFVGDVAQIPAWISGGQPTDLRYCEYTGDNIPEVFYGRFSANDVSELQPQIDKTLEYEQYAFPNPAFLDTCTMIAGDDAAHEMTWLNGQINYGTTYYFNTAHNLQSHTYLQPEPSGGDYENKIHLDVSHGECYSNYTAHGGVIGWSNPKFDTTNIAPLQNAHMYPLMVGNACLTNKYDETCFGEALLRANLKGAVGYIGASNSSYWDEDYWWGCGFKAVSANPTYNPAHLGAYDKMFHDHGEVTDDWFVTMGQMVVGGNLAVQESNSGMKTYYWEIYGLMGDPSLSIYFSVPPALQATYPSSLVIGTASLTVNTEPYAYVGLSLNDTLFVAGQCADSNGLALINFNPLTQVGMMGIVVTKQNRKPVIDSIVILQATGPFLTASDYSVSDSLGGDNDHNPDYNETITLNVIVSNVGLMTANDVTATLQTADTNVVITDNIFTLDSLQAGNAIVIQDAFTVYVKNNIPDQDYAYCAIEFRFGNDTTFSSFVLNLNAPVLNADTVIVIDPAPGGNNNGVLDPGETAVLKVLTTNTGHADACNTIGHLSVSGNSSAYMLATTSSYYIGDLPVSVPGYAYFNVVINGITPVGTEVTLSYTATAGSQNQYLVQMPFSMVIGEVPQYIITNGTQGTCLADFYDTGGPDNGYQNDEDFTMTFTPATTGAKLSVVFSAFDIEPQSSCSYDYLKIYNGNNTTAPLLGTWCGTNSPDSLASTDATGALTFTFHSDYSETFTGWAARVTCHGGPLTLLANAFPPQVCLGGSTQLTAIPSGGSGTYTYQWQPATYLDDPTSQSPISTPTEDISYTVTVYDGTTSLTSSPIAVTVLPVPPAATISWAGTDLISSIADGNQWYLNGALIPGASGQSYSPADPGDYYTVITDPLTGCPSPPSNILAFLPTGIPGSQEDLPVTIYPNPFAGQVTISCFLPEDGPVRIQLMDGYGRVLRDITRDSHPVRGTFSTTASTSGLAPGVYYFRIETPDYTVIKKGILTR